MVLFVLFTRILALEMIFIFFITNSFKNIFCYLIFCLNLAGIPDQSSLDDTSFVTKE